MVEQQEVTVRQIRLLLDRINAPTRKIFQNVFRELQTLQAIEEHVPEEFVPLELTRVNPAREFYPEDRLDTDFTTSVSKSEIPFLVRILAGEQDPDIFLEEMMHEEDINGETVITGWYREYAEWCFASDAEYEQLHERKTVIKSQRAAGQITDDEAKQQLRIITEARRELTNRENPFFKLHIPTGEGRSELSISRYRGIQQESLNFFHTFVARSLLGRLSLPANSLESDMETVAGIRPRSETESPLSDKQERDAIADFYATRLPLALEAVKEASGGAAVAQAEMELDMLQRESRENTDPLFATRQDLERAAAAILFREIICPVVLPYRGRQYWTESYFQSMGPQFALLGFDPRMPRLMFEVWKLSHRGPESAMTMWHHASHNSRLDLTDRRWQAKLYPEGYSREATSTLRDTVSLDDIGVSGVPVNSDATPEISADRWWYQPQAAHHFKTGEVLTRVLQRSGVDVPPALIRQRALLKGTPDNVIWTDGRITQIDDKSGDPPQPSAEELTTPELPRRSSMIEHLLVQYVGQLLKEGYPGNVKATRGIIPLNFRHLTAGAFMSRVVYETVPTVYRRTHAGVNGFAVEEIEPAADDKKIAGRTLAALLDIKIRHKQAIADAKAAWKSDEGRAEFDFITMLAILKQMRGFTYEILDVMFDTDGNKQFELHDILSLLAHHEESFTYQTYAQKMHESLAQRPEGTAPGTVIRDIIRQEFNY
ncbi:MAG: hypothetical protein TR69_WS6001001498 [candidate division WS6 bacterium OLB20]|uniref:Uncharacterized protein n=1 Tax=candidate division WS6 bacterium OLB20 TaxID=1617426 RepID=A0A136LW81_9BACT|nr:MAG: hypothetical protein TR69_WS6001001498 [candidate division WS6 bacterium OLB20]